jgi:hypothetical protein
MLFFSGYKLLLPDWRGYIIAGFSLVWLNGEFGNRQWAIGNGQWAIGNRQWAIGQNYNLNMPSLTFHHSDRTSIIAS